MYGIPRTEADESERGKSAMDAASRSLPHQDSKKKIYTDNLNA